MRHVAYATAWSNCPLHLNAPFCTCYNESNSDTAWSGQVFCLYEAQQVLLKPSREYTPSLHHILKRLAHHSIHLHDETLCGFTGPSA